MMLSSGVIRMMYSYHFTIVLLVALISLGTLQACSCPRGPKSNTEHWCNSNLVISGTIMSRKIVRSPYGMTPPVLKYNVRVEEVFKGHTYRSRTIVINTHTNTNQCGLTVLKGRRKYLLGAWDYGGGDIWISYCDWHKKRHRVTRRELASLRSRSYRCFAF